MYKKITLLLLLIITTLTIADDDTYVFEAKGEFAKELKSLVEKYSKEGKIDAKVYTKPKHEEDESIISAIFATDKTNMDGKAIYDKKCSKCHGIKGERVPGVGARAMTNMSKDDMEIAINGYKTDERYGGIGKRTMYDIAQTLRKVELRAIISYVKGSQTPTSNTPTDSQEETEVPTSYLQ